MKDELLELLEMLPDAMVVVDQQGIILHTNSSADVMFGYPVGGLRAQSLSVLMPVGTRAAHDEHVRRFVNAPLRRAMSTRTGLSARKADGTEFPVEIALSPLGSDALVLAAIRDVTERQRLERLEAEQRERLATSERFAAIGVLASSVAHELNNPLAALLSNLEILPSVVGRERDETVADCREAALHIRTVASDLLSIGREPQIGAVSIQAAVESALRMTRSIVQKRARIVTELAPTPLVRGSQGRLVQVLINLILNAEQAMSEVRGNHELRVGVEAASDGVICSVTDSGPGIPDERLPHIFEAFVTTKRNGTGLGLSFCQQTVADFGGRLTVRSEPGQTRFALWLPLAA